MKTIITIIALVCTTLSLQAFTQKENLFSTDLSQKDKPATIKVLLDKGLDRVLLEVKGRYRIYQPNSGVQIDSGTFSKRAFVTHDERGLRWGDLFPSVFEMRIVPADAQTTTVVNGTEYRGCVEIYDAGGRMCVVNEIDVENYLKATLNTQFTRPLDDEVMEAVAIVARTNTYYLISKNLQAKWHVTANEVSYQGYGATLQNLQVDKGIENTRHVVMTYEHTPFAATWTRNCAGKTADFATLFRKNVHAPKGVEITLLKGEREKMGWTFSMSKKELAHKIGTGGVGAVDLFVDKNSNKVYAIRIRDKMDTKTFDFVTFQKIVGDKRLRSSEFAVQAKGDLLTFTGFGDGPGVGLCLYSADKLAESGEKAPKILSTFFPDTKIENIRSLTK